MTGALIAAGWCCLALPVAVLVGRGIKAMDPGEDRGQPAQPPAVEEPDGDVDLLADLPVEILGPCEVDALFLRLVAPLDREMR